MRLSFAALAVAVLFAAHGALAAAQTVGSISISGLWTTATPPGAPTAAAYLTITNRGVATDRLIAVSSPLAAVGMLHQMELSNGIASMRMVSAIEILPGKTVTLAPEGFHIMLVSMKQPLKQGDTLPVTLTFEKAGKIGVVLPVLAIGAKKPPAP